jgi:hypothetical protein
MQRGSSRWKTRSAPSGRPKHPFEEDSDQSLGVVFNRDIVTRHRVRNANSATALIEQRRIT